MPPIEQTDLTPFLRLALDGVVREYPHHFGGPTLTSPADLRTPRDLHPAFFGCYDWHSAVHAHWTIARIHQHARNDAARAHLHTALTPDHLLAEASHFVGTGFERPYGWAWALRLHAELFRDAELAPCAEAMRPLVANLLALTHDYLPRLAYPVRAGTHANTAFALGLMIDWADCTGHASDGATFRTHAERLFGADADWSFRYEMSGEDFLSPGLTELDLMRRVLSRRDFALWAEQFLPRDQREWPTPIEDVDANDGRLGHLAGLNLSRASAAHAVGVALDSDAMRSLGAAHLACGLPQVQTGRYEGEHWLGTFAVYALTEAALDTATSA